MTGPDSSWWCPLCGCVVPGDYRPSDHLRDMHHVSRLRTRDALIIQGSSQSDPERCGSCGLPGAACTAGDCCEACWHTEARDRDSYDGGTHCCQVQEPLLRAAWALLDALNWREPRGLADLTDRARGAFNDLAAASGWKSRPRPEISDPSQPEQVAP